MMNKLIASAFEGIGTIADGLQLFQAFYRIATLSDTRLSLERRAAQLYLMFNDELRLVRAELEKFRRNPPLPPTHPRYAGAALWARSLLRRIQRNMSLLVEAKFLNQCPVSLSYEGFQIRLCALGW